jgi:hypothetical protein
MSMHRFQLLYLCSTGRAGSTMTMRGLAAHPQICVRAVHPYETRFTQFVHASQALGLTQLDFQQAVAHGPIKYGPFQSQDKVATDWIHHFLAQAPSNPLAEANDSFYSSVVKAQGGDLARVSWIAEKAIGHAIPIEKIRAGESARALFLFRDPRDTYFSIKAFNRKVGSEGSFNERLGDAKMFGTLISHWRQFQQLRNELGEKLHGARYEDLSCGNSAAWQAIFDWLEVDASAAQTTRTLQACAQRDQQVERHSTTDSVDQSIGRWRNQASPADLEIFTKFAPELMAMGYTV